jgi:gentisate 1,2-dioxygenase
MTSSTRGLLTQPAASPERQQYYDKIKGSNLSPLWQVLSGVARKEPVSAALPTMWRYSEIRPLLFEAVPLISVEEAERRVLNLANPGYPRAQVTNSLFAGLQLLLPGEIAPAHRHSQSALRFVIEGSGAYTAVAGEKTFMQPGDFIITPSWTWHDHGNDTDQPTVWMDVLDVPIVALLDAQFTEVYPSDKQIATQPVGDSLARFGSGMLPVGYESKSNTSPVFNYPYARTREALHKMRSADEWDPCHGLKLQFVNPIDGGFAMPTIGTFIQMLPKGFNTTPYRSTDSVIYSVIEGKGRSIITGSDGNEVVFDWGPRDILVAPSWAWHRHEADEDAVIFSASDQPVQVKLGLWREMRGNRHD